MIISTLAQSDTVHKLANRLTKFGFMEVSQVFRAFGSVIALGLVFSTSIAWGQDFTTPAMNDRADLEQNYNIERRREDGHVVLPIADRARVFNIYSFDGTSTNVQSYGSSSTMMLMDDSDPERIQKFRQKYNLKLWGRGKRVLSSSTFLIESLDGKERYYFKPQRTTSYYDNGRQITNSRNGPKVVRTATAVSKFVEELFRYRPPLYGDFLPENRGAVLLETDYTYSYSLRSVEPSRGVRSGHKLIPLAALVGSREGQGDRLEMVQKYADQAGLSPREWLSTEYAVKFAKFIAEMNFVYGLHPSAHTQNTLAIVNEQTGRIERFVFRDAPDMLIDGRIANRNFPPQILSELLSAAEVRQLYKKFSAETHNAWMPEVYFKNYTAQSLTLLFQETDRVGMDAVLVGYFLEQYLKEVRHITGLRTDLEGTLSKSALELIAAMKEGFASLEHMARVKLGHYTVTLDNIYSSILHSVFSNLLEKLGPDLKTATPLLQDKTEYFRKWKQAEAENKIIYLTGRSFCAPEIIDPASDYSHSFMTDSRGIIVLRDGIPIVHIPNLLPRPAVGLCPRLFL